MFLGFHRTHIHNTAQSLWIHRASHATLALPPAVQFDYDWGEGGDMHRHYVWGERHGGLHRLA